MAPADGKYCSIVALKQYGLGTTVDVNNPTVYNQGVTNTPDDQILSDVIMRAEAIFEMSAGTGYDQQTYANVMAFKTWIDRRGWLHLYARERGPITAVSAVQIRDIDSGLPWTSVTWVADDIILPSFESNRPVPEAWHVMLNPATPQSAMPTGTLLARWSYTGGFSTIPASLTNIIARLAWYIYKLREAPVSKIVNMPLGTMNVPIDVPPDIKRDIEMWRPFYG